MNYNLSYDPTTSPGNNATDSRYLFNTLGYFWRRVFGDRTVIEGLTAGQAAAAEQAYTNLMALVDSYSTSTIPIFDKRNWYPIYVYQSSLDNNTLLFGEDVKLGATVSGELYTFGEPIPEADGVYSLILPQELKKVGMIVDQIITPNKIWVYDTDIKIANGRLFFYGNPFDIPNIHITKVYNADGSESTDRLLTLWCYNAELDSENLKNNIGYLFGLNVPHNDTGKQVLASIVKLFTSGPTIADIKAVCLSCLGLPLDDTSGAVEIFDSVVLAEWWITKLGIDIETPDIRTQIAIDPTTKVLSLTESIGRSMLPLELPPTMLLGTYKYSLVFKNSVEPVSLVDGKVVFPVEGDPNDVKTFHEFINTPEFLVFLNGQLSAPLSVEEPINFINPVDFIFKAFMKSAAALIRVKFLNINQLAAFEEYFSAIKEALPPNILLLVLCDLNLEPEVFDTNTLLDDSNSTLPTGIGFNFPLNKTSESDMEHISFNSGTGLLIKDMSFSRVPKVDPITEQHNISLRVLS